MLQAISDLAVKFGGKLLAAIVVLIVGNIIVKAIVKRVKKAKFMEKIDPSVRTFVQSLIKFALYAILVVIIIGVLGIPMASVVTVIAASAATIGLALQGALGNLAGGLMILVFKPFKVGDFVEAAGASGVVKEITIFYTILNTLDNEKVTIPNGSLMNANVTNYSSEELRRVDLDFCTAFGTDSATVRGILEEAANSCALVVEGPEPVFAKVSGYKDNAVQYTLRAWCKSADYWDTYFALIEAVNNGFAAKSIPAPATNVNVGKE